jgi:hypothetical protein
MQEMLDWLGDGTHTHYVELARLQLNRVPRARSRVEPNVFCAFDFVGAAQKAILRLWSVCSVLTGQSSAVSVVMQRVSYQKCIVVQFSGGTVRRF